MYLALAAVLVAEPFWAQDWEAEARKLRPPDGVAAEQSIYRNLGARVRTGLDSVRRAANRTEADSRRPLLRRELTRSLGYKKLPWPPDLSARVTGTVRKPGYRIEKVVYQGLPGEWIPADLYLPDPLPGRAPGILFYNGHWFPDSKARPDFQVFCINMAKFGFITLNFETYGQGERGIARRDHRRAEALLVGVAQQGYAVYDAQASLQYLLSRPEVDPERIGMTGASGGGFDTWMNAALDDRIKVAVPVVGTCDLHEQAMARIAVDWDPKDHCHYVPGLFRYANNHELLAMAAPKPVLIVSASEDRSFPIRGVREVAAYGRALYRSYGLPSRFSYFEDSSEGHGYQKKKREAAYGWFMQWFFERGNGSPVPEPATETLPFDSPELRAFLPGENQAAGPAMVRAAGTLAAALPPRPARLNLADVLGPWPAPIPWTGRLGSARLQRLTVPAEAGLDIPAILLRPASPPKGLLAVVDDRGKEAALSGMEARSASAAGWAILAVDPRGIGELQTSKNTWLFAISLMQGENLVWRQSCDLLRAIGAVSGTPELRGIRLALCARGQDASLAASYLLGYTAEAKSPKLNWFILRDAFLTYHDFLERPKSMPLSFQLLATDRDTSKQPDREIPGSYMPFDVLDCFDIPQLLAAPRIAGLLVNPVDGDWDRKAPERARKLLSRDLRLVSGDAPDQAIARFVRQAAR